MPQQRIHHQDRHLGHSFSAAMRGGRRHLLQRLLDPRLPAQAGGIDQPHRPPVRRSFDRDRIPGQPGLRPGDHPLLAEQGVQQGGLAGIRAADDGQPQRPVGVAAASSPGAGSRSRISSCSSPMPSPCSAETGTGSPSPSSIGLHRRLAAETGPPPCSPPGCTGRPCRRSHCAKARSAGVRPVRASTTNTRRSAVAQSPPRRPRACGPGWSRAPPPPAPRYRAGGHPRPRDAGLGLLAVAGDTGRIVDDGDPAPDQAVEERGLAHIRPAEDDDGGEHARSLPHSRPAVPHCPPRSFPPRSLRRRPGAPPPRHPRSARTARHRRSPAAAAPHPAAATGR